MITCPSCSKQNQDHYKFCLGCGAELPRDVPPAASDLTAPAPRAQPTPIIEDETTSLGTGWDQGRAPAAAAAVETAGVCPQCGHDNPPANRFCASCGFKLARTTRGGGTPAAKEAAGGVTLTALNPDGTESGAYTLPRGGATIGRETGDIFAADTFLSPRHATFTVRAGAVFVRDEGSLNGVFRKLTPDQRYPVAPSQIFRIGQELIRFELLESQGTDPDGVEAMGSPVDGYVGRIALVLGRNTTGPTFPIPETGINLGRERGDVLFSEDGYVSGLHCRLSYEDGQLYVTDLGSSNGSFIRLIGEEQLANGDILLMGQQLFRVSL
ncbi:MAG: FHA domain-containing protein [Polyangiaceae bacterium]|nr:FHA domain-containing protein [Polyangiaceae bacterium]